MHVFLDSLDYPAIPAIIPQDSPLHHYIRQHYQDYVLVLAIIAKAINENIDPIKSDTVFMSIVGTYFSDNSLNDQMIEKYYQIAITRFLPLNLADTYIYPYKPEGSEPDYSDVAPLNAFFQELSRIFLVPVNTIKSKFLQRTYEQEHADGKGKQPHKIFIISIRL
jgi:hypothetical protein